MSPSPPNESWRRYAAERRRVLTDQQMRRFSRAYGRPYWPRGDRPVPPAPDRAGSAEGTYIVGFRLWKPRRIDKGLLRLTSTYIGAVWEPGANHAEHRPRSLGQSYRVWPEDKYAPHSAPAPECSCGLYAMHTPELAAPDPFGPAAYSPTSVPYVIGAVIAWGEIEVHASGFRAEYAMPLMLALPSKPPRDTVSYRVGLSTSRGQGVSGLRDMADAATVKSLALVYSIPFVKPDELMEAALQHGEPVPDQVRPSTGSMLEHEIVAMHAHMTRGLRWPSLAQIQAARRTRARRVVKRSAIIGWIATGVVAAVGLFVQSGAAATIVGACVVATAFAAGFSTLYLSRL